MSRRCLGELVTAYREAGRAELADKEQAEADILAEYLPEQLTAEEIAALVTEAIAETGAAELGPRGIGKVMGALQPKANGQLPLFAIAISGKKGWKSSRVARRWIYAAEVPAESLIRFGSFPSRL